MQSDDLQKLGELIEDIEVAMVTTVETDGTLHTRPLSTLKFTPDGDLWFFTALDSAKVQELDQDMRVSVAYTAASDNTYVVVAGTGAIVQDRAKVRELWAPIAKAWFPQGPDDPNLALLKVRIERAEYWTGPGKTAYMLGAAKAAITGKATRIGDNQKLTM